MTEPSKKPLMRCIGEFFGHIMKAVRQDVAGERRAACDKSDRQVIESTQRQERRGDVVLRETRIREVEFRSDE